jgi:hypothetical protein
MRYLCSLSRVIEATCVKCEMLGACSQLNIRRKVVGVG